MGAVKILRYAIFDVKHDFSSDPMLTAVVIEDQEMLAQLLAEHVLADQQIGCVARSTTVAEGQVAVLLHKPDIVILDNLLPDGRGIDLFRDIHEQVPATQWILCTASCSAPTIKESLALGIQGIVSKSSPVEAIGLAIHSVLAGREFLCTVSSRLLEKSYNDMLGASLSGRENETVRLLAAGLSIKEIAAMMGLSPKTVNLHVKNLCAKLRATSYVDAVNKARALSLV